MKTTELHPGKIRLSNIGAALRSGWDLFRLMPMPSIAYALVATLIGFVLLFSVGRLGISPMSLPFAGGFMLIAPAMLSGFFKLAVLAESGEKATLSTPFVAFLRTSLQTWMVSVFCAFMFLIWITDAGILYSFLIGATDLHYELPWLIRPNQEIGGFWFWGAVMGSVLAFIIFCVSAFSIPLLFEERGTLVQAVHASVRTVFNSFLTCMCWAVLLSLSMVFAILLLPTLPIVLPVMAYASFKLYRAVFAFPTEPCSH